MIRRFRIAALPFVLSVLTAVLSAAPGGSSKVNPEDGLPYESIPPGSYDTGCLPSDNECYGLERHRQRIMIAQGFWIGRTEVTQAAYTRIVNKDPSRYKGANRPVDSVGWSDATAYCKRVGMRLPTESEWEYAAYGGTSELPKAPLGSLAWYDANSNDSTHPVAAKLPNGYGLSDMLGNVWEWVQDAGMEPGEHILKGGSFYNIARDIRVSGRLSAPADLRHRDLGFRCASSSWPGETARHQEAAPLTNEEGSRKGKQDMLTSALFMNSWWTDTIPLIHQQTYPRLLLALLLGICIGAERQWRQRAAGLRTNTLVCLGAAAFVDLGLTVSPHTTQVIAYVVSGVGFLGAGAIMKEGVNIRGLNTAATLWCSAAVGACVGSGELLDAIFVTALLIIINIALRPFSRYIDRRSLASLNLHTLYQVRILCTADHRAETEHHLTHAIATRSLVLRSIRVEDNEEADTSMVQAVMESSTRAEKTLEDLANDLRACPGVKSVDIAATDPEAE